MADSILSNIKENGLPKRLFISALNWERSSIRASQNAPRVLLHTHHHARQFKIVWRSRSHISIREFHEETRAHLLQRYLGVPERWWACHCNGQKRLSEGALCLVGINREGAIPISLEKRVEPSRQEHLIAHAELLRFNCFGHRAGDVVPRNRCAIVQIVSRQ